MIVWRSVQAILQPHCQYWFSDMAWVSARRLLEIAE